MSARYAIYYTPAADHSLTRFTAAWLGRDPSGGVPGPRPTHPTLTAYAQDALTAEPRRYGFHATLKPPLHLAAGHTEADLLTAVDHLAARLAPVAMPPLQAATLGTFIALVPAAPCPALDNVAEACVRELDPFRAPLSAVERARRIGGKTLSPHELALLDRWGYPYVLEAFRFHMTLTGSLPADQRDTVLAALEDLIDSAWLSSLRLDALTVFCQPRPETPFTVLHRAALAG